MECYRHDIIWNKKVKGATLTLMLYKCGTTRPSSDYIRPFWYHRVTLQRWSKVEVNFHWFGIQPNWYLTSFNGHLIGWNLVIAYFTQTVNLLTSKVTVNDLHGFTLVWDTRLSSIIFFSNRGYIHCKNRLIVPNMSSSILILFMISIKVTCH